MLAAILGLIGIGLGALLTSLLSADRERRNRRVEALSDLVAASARVIVAHEGLYELVATGRPPDPQSPVAHAALEERVRALAEWRTIHGKVLVVVPRADDLDLAANNFVRARAVGTRWVRAYQKWGPSFDISKVADVQRDSWKGMHEAHHELIAASRRVVEDDLRSWPRRLKRRSSERQSRDRAATAKTRLDL
jgi:hypothetical protein